MAAYLYQTDANELAEINRIATVLKGWLGDRAAYAGFDYGELTWQANPAAPVGINAMGTTRIFADGVTRSVDGVVPDDMRRCSGCAGADPVYPLPYEDYVYGALNGIVMQTEILRRHGFADIYSWQNNALRRTFVWLHSNIWTNGTSITDFRADGRGSTTNDRNPVWIINKRYGTTFYEEVGITPSEIIGFADWTHQ